MTLIITEISRIGIVMAADSAYTPAKGGTTRYGPKVFGSAKLNLGVSMWGNYLPQPPDAWLSGFIAAQEASACPDIHSFASRLRDELRTACPNATPTVNNDATLGFHVAGYDRAGVPLLYHVHNGASQALALRNINVNPQLINANLDLDSATSKQMLISPVMASYMTRNGDYRLYAWISATLDPLLAQLDPLRGGGGLPTSFGNVFVPAGNTLQDRGQYLAFQIKLMSSMYGISNIASLLGTTAAHIGGDALVLEFSKNQPPGAPRIPIP
jgi:hypothetical protein